MNIKTHTHTPNSHTQTPTSAHNSFKATYKHDERYRGEEPEWLRHHSAQRRALTFKVCPFLDSLQFAQRPGVAGGGSLNVLIRTGSPGENTQTYLYILFQEGSSPRARRSCIETNSCPSSLPPLGDEPTETLGIQRTFSRSDHIQPR